MQAMEVDAPDSQKLRLFHFLRHIGGGPFNSHLVVEWGLNNYCDEPKRRLRELVGQGWVRRLSDIEINLKQLRKPGAARTGWYEVV